MRNIKLNIALIGFFIVLSAVVILSYQKDSPLQSSNFFFVKHVFNQRYVAAKRAQMGNLNLNLIVDYSDLYLSPQQLRNVDLKKFTRYLTLVTQFMPDQPEAYAMLGFCRYYEGDVEGALDAYHKAIELGPQFFWSYYNVAVILIEAGHADQAGSLLEAAMRLDPRWTMEIIMRSKIYADVLRLNGGKEYNVAARLQEGYQQAWELLKGTRQGLQLHFF